MYENASKSEKKMTSATSEMQSLLQNDIAPRSIGNVETRIRHASRKMKTGFGRVRTLWYADARCSPKPWELDRARALAQQQEEDALNDELSKLRSRLDRLEAELAALSAN